MAGGASAARDAFRNMARSVRRLAEVPSRAAVEAAEVIGDLAQAEFDNETDPYGRPWSPLAESTIRRKGGDDEILHRSGDMRDSLAVLPLRGMGIGARIDSPAEFHQVGTKDMPKRMILPDNRGLPREWEQAIAAAIDNSVATALEGL